MKKHRKRRLKIKNIIISVIIVFVLAFLGYYSYQKLKTDKTNKAHELLIKSIKANYSEYVKTTKETKLYDKSGKVIGEIGKDVSLVLEKVDNPDEYLQIAGLEDTYIKYSDITKIDEFTMDDRYKVYIPYNLNVKTKNKTQLYDEEGNLIFTLNKTIDEAIIVKDTDKYGISFYNQLLYIKKDDNSETYEHHNTDKHNASGIGVLNYHSFYDENNAYERSLCPTEICHSKSQFKSHLEYFKEHDLLTLKMKEVEMYVDGKIQLPKSVLITIDDGGYTKHAVDLLTEYKMYATIFMVTSWFDPKEYYATDYIELHSHSHNMHNTGECPTGQGGAIQCWSEEKIQADLKTARELLNNTTYFCYPFYEYNDYSIRMLKEAGFTMSFIGESSSSDNLVHPGDDKFRLHRFVIVNYTTLSNLDNYFGKIK